MVFLTWSASTTVNPDSVPPADLIGPAKNKHAYFVPSLFSLIWTSLSPCIGATVTPSVTTAKPTRMAVFNASSGSISPNLPLAISSDILRAAIS